MDWYVGLFSYLAFVSLLKSINELQFVSSTCIIPDSLPDPSEISSGSKFALLSVAVAILGTISVCDGKERLIRVILDQVKGDQLSTLMRVVQSAQESYQFSVPSHSEESANSTSPFEDQDRSTTNTSFLNTTGISSASVSAVERENAELRRIIESHERDMAALSMNLVCPNSSRPISIFFRLLYCSLCIVAFVILFPILLVLFFL